MTYNVFGGMLSLTQSINQSLSPARCVLPQTKMSKRIGRTCATWCIIEFAVELRASVKANIS